MMASQTFEVASISDLKGEVFCPVLRNQIGAGIGVQPFGGEGHSGPGPKAGAPHPRRPDPWQLDGLVTSQLSQIAKPFNGSVQDCRCDQWRSDFLIPLRLVFAGLRPVKLHAVAPLLLGLVHGGIGALQDLFLRQVSA